MRNPVSFDLATLIDEQAIDAAGRPELRAALVEHGNDPNRTAALTRHLCERNDGLEVARTLLHWVRLIAGDAERRIDGFKETGSYVLAPAVVTGVGAPFGGLALVAWRYGE